MKRRSDKMEAQMAEYRPKAEAFKRAHPWCHCCKKRRSVHVHHKAGRINGNLLNESTWIAVCFPCHNLIHENPEWAQKKGYIL